MICINSKKRASGAFFILAVFPIFRSFLIYPHHSVNNFLSEHMIKQRKDKVFIHSQYMLSFSNFWAHILLSPHTMDYEDEIRGIILVFLLGNGTI